MNSVVEQDKVNYTGSKKNTRSDDIIYSEYNDENFLRKLGKFTFGLDKVIPWEDGNLIFSGGLLFDIITNRFTNDLMDIDLFFYGSKEAKLDTINKLLCNLDKEQYSYLFGYNYSVMYIFIQGIPRIIQLIMTDNNDPESIINEFDLSFLMSYSDGEKIYCSNLVLDYLNSTDEHNKKIKIIFSQKNRILKYIERGVINKNPILDTYNFVLNQYDSEKYLKYKKQIKLYKLTNNLTIYPDGEIIDLAKLCKKKLDSIIHLEFGCNICHNVDDLKNDFKMYGKFVNYIHLKKINKNNEQLNVTLSGKYININVNRLSLYRTYRDNKLFSLEDENSIYIPCNFISSEKIEKDINGNKIIKIKFNIYDKKVIKYLTKKLNKYAILEQLNNNVIDINLIKSKYKLDESKIYTPFVLTDDVMFKIEQENEKYEPKYKRHLRKEEFNIIEKLEICSKMYNSDIDNFDSLNDFGVLHTLETEQAVNCLFDIRIYMCISKDNNIKKIEYIDINLRPRYIYKKI